MESCLRENLLSCARGFATAGGLQIATVSQRAAGDWRFMDRIANGASFTARKYDEIMGWFSENWPVATPWPENVYRAGAVASGAEQVGA